MYFKAKVFQNKRTKQLMITLSKKKLECLIKKKELEAKIPKYIKIKKKNLIF